MIQLVKKLHTLDSLMTYGRLNMVHACRFQCSDVDGFKINMSLWITMAKEFLI